MKKGGISDIVKAEQQIFKGAAVIFVGAVFSKLMTLVYRLVIARGLGAEKYGLLMLGLSVFGFATVLSLLGLPSGVARFVAFYKGKKDMARVKGTITSALRMTFPVSVVVGLALFLLSEHIGAGLFGSSEVGRVIRILMVGLPFYVLLNIFHQVFYAFQRPVFTVITEKILGRVLIVGLSVVAIYSGLGLSGLAWADAMTRVLISLVGLYILEKKVFPILKNKVKAVKDYTEMWRYSYPLILSSLLWMVISYTDTLMIGYFMTPEDVGVYNAALPLAQLLLMVPSAVIPLFMPKMSEMIGKGRSYKPILRKTILAIFGLNLIGGPILIVFGKPILIMLFGEAYVVAYASMVVLVFGYLLTSTMARPLNGILSAQKRTKVILHINIVAASSNILANLLLIPKYGLVGAAWATTLSLTIESGFYQILGTSK